MAAEETKSEAKPTTARHVPDHVYLISYPKIVFLYPTLLAALAAGIYMTVTGNATGSDNDVTEFVAAGFLAVMGLNLIVLSFDFPRTTSLTLFFFCFALVTGGILFFQTKPEMLGAIGEFLEQFRPWANATFYYTVAAFLTLIYIAVGITVQFDYWEVRHNELLHHHGILSNMERFSAPHLRVDKEINDVFEYLLLRSGRLILHPSNERRAVVLDNVFFISHKEQRLTRMLGALQVEVRTDD